MRNLPIYSLRDRFHSSQLCPQNSEMVSSGRFAMIVLRVLTCPQSPKRTASSSKPEDLRESDDLAPAKTETKAKKQKAGSTNDKGDSEDKKGRAIVPWTQGERVAVVQRSDRD